MTTARHATAYVLMLPLLSAAQCYAAATVSVLNPPSTLTPGQPVSVTASFTKTPDEPEKRVVVRVDLHDADTHEKVSGGISDSAGAGYTAMASQVACSVPVPANASGQYYFKATVAPWSLNRQIVTQYQGYPTNGTYTYYWDSSRQGDYGVTREVRYLGSVICPDYPGNTTYCSGVAFETFVFAFENYNNA